jgi:protein-tyrosine phosphatase
MVRTRAGAPAQRDALDADLAELRERGISALLSLTERPLPPEALERHGLAAAHVPIADLTAPEPEEIERALGFIDVQRGLGRAIAVHCLMGQGRTGTVLAAYLIRAGASAEEALARVRAICPGAVGVPQQERALMAYARRRDWVV